MRDCKLVLQLRVFRTVGKTFLSKRDAPFRLQRFANSRAAENNDRVFDTGATHQELGFQVIQPKAQ